MVSNLFTLIFIPGLVAFLTSLISTPFVIKIYQRFNLLDDPQKSSHPKILHSIPVPRGGGIPIYLSLAIAGLFAFGIDKHFLGILFGASILTLVGVLDDIYDINPYVRIITGLLAAASVVSVGIGIAYITNPLAGSGTVIHLNQPQLVLSLFNQDHTIWVLADLFAFIWVVWVMNIVNWSKGLDGQMPGFVAIAAFFIGLLSFRFVDDITQWPVIILAAITSFSFLGFLIYNRFPQKIMPGYGGGSLGGFLLAVLAILSGAKVAALILILGIPMTDAALTIIRRILSGKSPVWGDRGHLHHHLLDKGWTKPQIALFYWLTTALLGLLTLTLNSAQKLFTILMIGTGVSGLIILLKLIPDITKRHEQ